MRLLLDTNVFIWWWEGNHKRLGNVKELIESSQNVLMSPIVIWEISIKQATGKLKSSFDLTQRVRDSEFRELPVRFEHALVAGKLPPIHNDPFDRMLVAQAKCESLMLVTADSRIPQYDVDVLAV